MFNQQYSVAALGGPVFPIQSLLRGFWFHPDTPTLPKIWGRKTYRKTNGKHILKEKTCLTVWCDINIYKHIYIYKLLLSSRESLVWLSLEHCRALRDSKMLCFNQSSEVIRSHPKSQHFHLRRSLKKSEEEMPWPSRSTDWLPTNESNAANEFDESKLCKLWRFPSFFSKSQHYKLEKIWDMVGRSSWLCAGFVPLRCLLVCEFVGSGFSTRLRPYGLRNHGEILPWNEV